MKFWLLTPMVLLICACGDGKLRSVDTPRPGEHATVEVISANGESLSKVSYNRISSMEYFKCSRDKGSSIHLEGRSWIPDGSGHLSESTIELFIPSISNSGQATSVVWRAGSVMVYGRLHKYPFHSLGAKLLGKCDGNVLRRGSRLSGSIVCRNFQGFQPNGIGMYDLLISDLACSIY